MKKGSTGAVLLLALLWLGTCKAAGPPGLDLDEQQVSAVAWMQLSDEYFANCWQTFNCARTALELMLDRRQFKKPAIIIDVDETILDNSAFQAYLIATAQLYSDSIWEQWALAQAAPAIPGSREFLTYASSRDVEIFYITNRTKSIAQATLSNMQSLGFPFSDQKHLLPREDTRSKKTRRDLIIATHQVLLYLGDNLNDFPGDYEAADQTRRRAQASADRELFGTQYFILPNPVYGAWSNLLIGGRTDLPADEQARLRKSRLAAWRQQ